MKTSAVAANRENPVFCLRAKNLNVCIFRNGVLRSTANYRAVAMNFLGSSGPEKWDGQLSNEMVALDRMEELIRWIDPLKDAQEARAALEEFQRRVSLFPHTPHPLEIRNGGRRLAGAYVMLLGARVAAVAGVRAIDNHTMLAVGLLEQLIRQVKAHGVIQIQAILDGTDSVANDIVELAGFKPLAELQQLVLSLSKTSETTFASDPKLPSGKRWQLARDIRRKDLTDLISETFVDTLDCPALNGLRSVEDVLDGFLDGQRLEDQMNWWLLEAENKYLGCVFVNQLPIGATELAYMGLSRSVRGRGYGKLLLDKGIQSARMIGSEMMVAAVDTDNWPAVRLYLQTGFQEHGRVQAWFYSKTVD